MEIVRIIITGLIICFSSWLVGYIGLYLRTKIYDKDLKILRPPLLIFWIGLIEFLGCAITILIIFFVSFNEENAVWAIGYFLVSLLGFWLILYALNWRIEIKEESFIFRNMFRKKREIKYSEITKLKRLKIGGYRIYIGKKSIAVDYFIKGADNLWDILKVLKLKNDQR
jgi:hypothetical protein